MTYRKPFNESVDLDEGVDILCLVLWVESRDGPSKLHYFMSFYELCMTHESFITNLVLSPNPVSGSNRVKLNPKLISSSVGCEEIQ